MPSKIVGITIDIEGKTSGLTKSLQEANSSINKTTNALKDVNKALQLDPTNVDLLAQKEILLNKQIEQTNNKLEILSQVATDANDALARGDISEEQYASLTAEISRTESALGDLEAEANSSSSSLEEVGTSAEEAGSDTEDFGETASKACEIAASAFAAVVAAAAAVGAALVEIGLEGASALLNTTTGAATLADNINTLSKTTGLSTETLQELNYASKLLDVDTSTVTGSITKLTKTMNSAADGSEATAAKFEALGIAYVDSSGEMRDAETVFWEAIDALGQIDNETERDAAAMELFGKSAKELNPLIEAGSDAFAELADEANAVGYVMDNETLDSFNALQDNLDRLDNISLAVSNSFGAVLLPVLTDLSSEGVSLLGDFSAALASSGGDIEEIGAIIEEFAPEAVSLINKYAPQVISIIEKVIGTVLDIAVSLAPQILSLAGSLIEQLGEAIANNAEALSLAFGELLSSAVNSIISLLPVLIPIAIELVLTLVNAILDNASLIVDSAIQLVLTLVNSILAPEQINTILLAATTIITTILNGLTSALPVLIPAAVNAIITIVDTLLSGGCLEQIIQAALVLITTLATSLVEYLPVLISYLPTIIAGIRSFLTGDALPEIIEAGYYLLTSLVGDLPAIISALLSAMVTIISDLGSYITGEGATDLFNCFQAAFNGIIEGASTWGYDLIQNFIDGILSQFSNLTNTVKDVATLVDDYIGFSVPKFPPLSDFDKSGKDMIDLFISSMNSEEGALEQALTNTAGIISAGWDNSLTASANAATYSSANDNISRLESAISSPVSSAEGGSWIFPIYIGDEHIDTIVVDAVDRYNYISGGH